MANLIANANGDLTGAATFASAEASTNAYTLTRALTNSTGTTTSVVYSAAFSAAAQDVDGVVLFLNRVGASGGTFTVTYSTDGVALTRQVTVNASDLPTTPSFVFFKFGSNFTPSANATTKIGVQSTVGGSVTVYRTATAADWVHAVRRTAAATPAAGDVLLICGEWTAAATVTTRTVTMNQTATTAYGSTTVSATTPNGIDIGSNGVLTYGTTASTNYVLRVAGDFSVWADGTLNIGTSGTPMPRTSSAVLEFLTVTADGDFGLTVKNGATKNIYGLSRTSGKNIVKTLLTADTPSTPNLLAAASLFVTNSTVALTNFDPSGTSIVAFTTTSFSAVMSDTVTNATHSVIKVPSSVAGNTTQVFSVWLARGTGTNNRFVRILVGNSAVSVASSANGFFADIDLQAGTIGACTVIGNGTATSSSIVAFGTGYICTIIGAVSSATAAPNCYVAACNASGVVSYAGDGTPNFIYYNMQLYTASSLPSAALSVADDTGWLTGDVVAVASTSRTASECEPLALLSNAGASTATMKMLPAFAHSGTSPTQAEIILLTRNVKIRSTSATLMSYVFVDTTATVHIEWAEFYFLGLSTAGKRGLEVATTTGSASITFCSFHDCEASGFTSTGSAHNNITFSNNVGWNLATTVSVAAFSVAQATSGTNITLDSNTVIRAIAASTFGFFLGDVGVVCTNNVAVGIANIGFSLAEGATIGTFSGNTAHSNGGIGINFGTVGITGAAGTLSSWRNTGAGFNISGPTSGMIIDGMTAFGNTTSNVLVGGTAGTDVILRNGVFSGDTTFSLSNGIAIGAAGIMNRLLCETCTFGVVTGIKTAHGTGDISPQGSPSHVQFVTLKNCNLASSAEVANQTLWASGTYISSEKHDQTAGNHKTWTLYGVVQTDSTFFNTASPSMRMTPNNASFKLESAPKDKGMLYAVANGATVSPSVYIRKSTAGDGAAYTGAQPRLIARANPAIGITSDTVLATYSGGTGAWAQISGTTAAATDDGAVEIIVDCDGSSGWISVDDWA